MIRITSVALDETRFYNIAEDDKPFIEKILGVYMVDKGDRTYCCEITPSYWLEHLYDTVQTTPETPDEVRERLSETYEFLDHHELGNYMHCSDVEQIPADHQKDSGEFDSLEDAREYLQGNCPF